ncbi:protein EDS1L-like [Senna tora]|uniref:Protein EDS1L-like n=1 Tax=Senna tora TaxID=362788 RepID=A0A835CKW8_9FABA|nr:protein EDS1L-like [Senna tora]
MSSSMSKGKGDKSASELIERNPNPLLPTDMVPQEVEELQNLEKLYLVGTRITHLPLSPNLPKLEELYLHDNANLTEIPTLFFQHMPKLQVLDLSYTGIRGLPSSMFKLAQLKALYMRGCKQFKQLLQEIEQLTNLEKLDLSGTPIAYLPPSLNLPKLRRLFLQGNLDLMEIPPSFFDHMPLLSILDLSCTSIHDLPSSFFNLEELREFYLKDCELFMELPPEIERLRNLKKLDLDGTQITHLPKEIQELSNLKSLSLSFFGYHHDNGHGKKCMSFSSSPMIPLGVISKLTHLRSLRIDVNPDSVWWHNNAEQILVEIAGLESLRILDLYVPEATLLKLLIGRRIAYFRFIVGHHMQRIISRAPPAVEVKFKQSNQSLRFVNGVDFPNEVKIILQSVQAFFLDRHMTINYLSQFGKENLSDLELCILAECNEMHSIVGGEDSQLGWFNSLKFLTIFYMKNLRSISQEPTTSLSFCRLKFLALHTCPELTSIFTIHFLDDLSNLEELIVEDCPKVYSLISSPSSEPTRAIFLPRLRKLSLLYLPELVSISNGFHIGESLEKIGFYYCPKLGTLSSKELSSRKLKVIKGEIKWWEALKWSEAEWGQGRPHNFNQIFCPIDEEVDVLAQLTSDEVESSDSHEEIDSDAPSKQEETHNISLRERTHQKHGCSGSERAGGESIVLKEERLKKAYSQAFKAHTSDKLYLVEKTRGISSEVIISFPGFGPVKDWFSETLYGDTQINLSLFPSLRSIGNDEAAFVNKAFLQRFEAVLGKPSFIDEVEEAMAKQKQIVFTGHSSGAAVAILATLWALDKYITPNINQMIPPLCVTFGSPLIGNHIFSHATRREKWSGNFMHFVMKYDIMPRLLLAPVSSFEERFDPVLQFFNPKSKHFMDESIGNDTMTSEFYKAVMTNAEKTTSHAACKLMGTKNAMPAMLANFIALSPYRPFGTYIFCTGSGKLIVISNSDAVLQLLYFSAQLSTKAEAALVACKCLQEHTIYGEELKESLAMQSVFYLDQLQLEKLTLFPDSSDGDITETDMALNDLGLSTRGRLCLRAAGEWEKVKARNEENINKKNAEECMKKVEEYKKMYETQKWGYYDAFKQQNDEIDFRSNVKRLELASVWDEITEMLKRYELPDEFEGNSEWIKLGTEFRRLLEPLDIANYYRHARNNIVGSYMFKGRPGRYRYTQRWLEHEKRKPKGAYSESCFMAEVEELYLKTRTKSSFEDVKEEVLKLERDIKRWNDEGVLSRDVFLEESTFVKWWKTLPQQHQQESCIRSLIEGR